MNLFKSTIKLLVIIAFFCQISLEADCCFIEKGKCTAGKCSGSGTTVEKHICTGNTTCMDQTNNKVYGGRRILVI